MSRLLIPVLLLCPSISFAAIAGEGAGQPAAAGDGATRFRLFAPAWRLIGEQKPQDVAKKFTVIYGNLPPAPFHEGNPRCQCIKYILGPYVGEYLTKTLPPECLAHDAEGKIIKARSFANWLVVPDNPKWLEHEAQEVPKLMNSEFDGLFVDSMGTAPVETNYLFAKPINPNTGRLYTKAEWMAAECVMLETIAKAMPKGKLLTLNGLGRGERYWAEPEGESPRCLLKYVDGAMSELIWRQPNSPLTAWPTVDQWMGEIRMVQDVDKRGLMGFWWTKCWSDGNTSDNEPNADKLVPQWRRFAMGSVLLAAGPRAYFNFDTVKNDKPKSNAAEYFAEYDAPLGDATGPMEQVGQTGVYLRRFTNGLVVVNPTDAPANNIPIPAGAYKSWGEDRTVGSPLTIAPHTGLILTLQ
ncbi:MAG: putative glycoside hydrolase [Candidatus Sumerlaeota bacterium]|nr:putative glycoside hydrolase [Candidatus Sumerlaeota bacterium]